MSFVLSRTLAAKSTSAKLEVVCSTWQQLEIVCNIETFGEKTIQIATDCSKESESSPAIIVGPNIYVEHFRFLTLSTGTVICRI